MDNFLPMNATEMKERGWESVDFVFVCGDAYVDHPSFGQAIISRLLESHGYKVGIISQPDWKKKESIAIFGEPRLGFLVSSGNMDSMVNHYTVSKKRRTVDAYTPGGITGKRPDYATVVYGNLIRQTYKSTPIILGGVEASLRRLAHYDYWRDKLKPSALLDSGADILIYGMGERAILEVAEALESGLKAEDITYVDGTVVKVKGLNSVFDALILPSYESLKENKLNYAKSFKIQMENTDSINGKRLVEEYPNQIFLLENPPAKPLSTQEMDDIYALPYQREVHPEELKKGEVSAIAEVKYSLTSHRGCFGGCNFCALGFHQGRRIQGRSHESILREARDMVGEKAFKGYIHDVGGPTGNFRVPSCEKQLKEGVCKRKQCLFPKPCKNLIVDHQDYLELLRKLRKLEGVKKVFIRSGIRFDYVNLEKNMDFLKELCKYHISGQLRVAPEHVSNKVLRVMGKPSHEVYERFTRSFNDIEGRMSQGSNGNSRDVEKGFKKSRMKIKENSQQEKLQYLVPYLMSSHPGSTLEDGIELALYCRELGFNPEQVQDFYPTPSTVSTCMYYTGVDPRTMEKVTVIRNPHEKNMQRALIQYRNPANHKLVLEALKKVKRQDLIGFGKECLIKPRVMKKDKEKSRGNPTIKEKRCKKSS